MGGERVEEGGVVGRREVTDNHNKTNSKLCETDRRQLVVLELMIAHLVNKVEQQDMYAGIR